MASAQIGLSLLLLIGAGLFLRSLLNLQTKDPGFDKHHVLTIASDPFLAGYDAERARTFYRSVLARVSQLPGVLSATFARVGLVSGSEWGSGITVEGYQPKDGDEGPERNAVGADYFKTLRIPILRGREFSLRDVVDAPHVAIVNERFAKFYFGNDDPIGRHIGPGGPKGVADSTIVGVAKDGKYASLRETTPRFWYNPYEQAANIHSISLYVRTAGEPEKAAGSIQRAIASIDPTVPVFGIKTLEEQIDENLARDRMVATLSAFFAVLAAMIAAIGLYGVMMYSVTSRTREIGIRMALGAQRAMVIGPIMRETAVLAAVGVALGVSCALGLARLVAALLFEMAPSDQPTFIAAGVLMTAVALAAGYLPARRAAQVDPAIALRYD
jgi:predicted permease